VRVFVTGGNGFIGSTVVRTLVAEGHHVRCLLRPASDTSRIEDLPIERVMGDVRDAASLRAGAAGCDGMVHLAGLSSWKDIHSPLMHQVVIDGTRNLLEAVKECGGPRTVFVSSTVAINGTTSPIVHNEDSLSTLRLERYTYAQAKTQAEALCREAAASGQPVTIVNPGEVYGPRDTALITAGNLVDFAKSSPVLVCQGGTSITYVEDVAAGIMAALEHGRRGERYILAGENLTIRQLADLTLQILGQQKRIVSVPNSILRGIAAVGGRLRLPLPFEPAIVPYATLYWFMDNSKARSELGVSFRSARDALVPTLSWLRDAGLVAS
jgi:dihydroflavonol-4-reductase